MKNEMQSLNIKVQAKKELIDKYGEEYLTKLATEGFSKEEFNKIIEKVENLKLKDGRTVEDLVFDIIKQENEEKQILEIIELVKIIEKEVNGLNDELISYKYTHGHCFALATLISSFRREVQGLRTICKGIGDGSFAHVVVRINNLEFIEGFSYYDINGQKTPDEMENFIREELMTEEERKRNKNNILSCETDYVNNDNVVTAAITKKIHQVLEKQNTYA